MVLLLTDPKVGCEPCISCVMMLCEDYRGKVRDNGCQQASVVPQVSHEPARSQARRTASEHVILRKPIVKESCFYYA